MGYREKSIISLHVYQNPTCKKKNILHNKIVRLPRSSARECQSYKREVLFFRSYRNQPYKGAQFLSNMLHKMIYDDDDEK